MSDIFAQIKDKWFIIIFIVSMILWYGNINTRMDIVEANQEEQEDVNKSILEIKDSVTQVQRDVTWIKDYFIQS
jgi:hypothetical protein